jgi:hypothetical protein
MGVMFSDAAGLGINAASGRFIIPGGDASSFTGIPASARGHLSTLSASPVTKVDAGGNNSYTITRQDGSQQWLQVNPETGETVFQQRNSIGFAELTVRKDGGYSEVIRRTDGTIGTHTVRFSTP